MEREELGIVNAYILNLMMHYDKLRMDEYDVRDMIEKHFKRKDEKKKERRIRPQHVREFHMDPLVKRRWLRKLPEGKYERIGELRRVNPLETLFDQFKG